MVFAISGVTRFRKGLTKEHPYGYFVAAQSYLQDIPLIGSLDAIQNLLLVARFGVYHHIGTSLWEISRFCMRQCVEHSLHTPPKSPIPPLQEQLQRRIFWDCYILDRYSSDVLGRPFAIADADISVHLPANVTDATIIQSPRPSSLCDIETSGFGEHPELAVFIRCIELRRITSRIHYEFYVFRHSATGNSGQSTTQNLSAGHVYVKLHQFLAELENWRQGAPFFPEPRCLYERPEWYDFMMEKDKLLVIRGAMHSAPRRNGQTPEDLLILCLNSATKIIQLYSLMLELKCITWTRNYFQIIFAAGLCITHCVAMGVHERRGKDNGTMDPVNAISLCSRILQWFKTEMPDAGRFSIVFEILKDNLLGSLPHSNSSEIEDTQMPQRQQLAAFDARLDPEPLSQELVGTESRQSWNQAWVLPGELTTTNEQGLATSPMVSSNNVQLQNFAYPFSLQQQDALDWPTLTDEMMEHLEVGLGEFAWGSMDEIFYTWDVV
ncbi:fungal-specific transcription factor domain-containing protein [Stachybotrys elegans]|uniref:Fungal-specific transcription factor domain-containing protein n=1 Tax=Stachybotrys elegans TaxID=80388 RepID=A0A8K0SGD4_9HYPO|nr:fungal-specific transcription factor domain-containing protein [Stachybotrys elegans]